MQHWGKGLAAGGGTALIGVLLTLTPLGASFEQNQGLHWLFKVRGAIAPPPEVVVVAIDDRSGEQLGLSKLPREWPRSVHGRLVENLARRGVSAIVFDFDFQIPKRPADDQAFGQAIAAANRVVLATKLTGKRQPIVDREGRTQGSVWVEQLLPPIPPLAEAAKGLGPFPLPKTEVAVYEFWAFKPSVGNAPTIPAMALQIHARNAYPIFFRLLEDLGTTDAAPLPRPPDDRSGAAEMLQLAQGLRTRFDGRPELAGRLRERLADAIGNGTPTAEHRLLKALIGLYSEGDFRYLNFYGPPGTIRTIPYHLLAGNADTADAVADLAGKVAFVGFSDLYDPGQPDRFYTVFTNQDGVDLSGVEIAATAFGNLLDDSSLRTFGTPAGTAILAAFGAIVGLLLALLPAIAGVPLVLALSAAYAVGAYQAFAEAHIWLPLTIPLLVQLPQAVFVGLSLHYLSERSKKRRATRAIRYYLPENVVREFTENAADPSVLNRVTHGVCFASDMAGFTTIAEQMAPGPLASFLNDYFETLSKPLRGQNVDVVEFRADGIMCAWTSENTPEMLVRDKAIRAALAAVEAIAAFKQRHALFAQSLRIGLESGPFYVGHAGGGGHFVYSIVGDCANTAARIEGLNKHLGTQVLASRATVEGIDGFLWRFLGEFRFVGKSEALPIVEIVAASERADETQLQLCIRYAEAMEFLAAGEWPAAADRFAALLEDYPDDGPTRFHLNRCRQHSHESPPPGSPLTVVLGSK